MSAPTHGHTKNYKWSRTYRIWAGMLARCRYTNRHNSNCYSLKGINFCSEWKDFTKFLLDMGESPAGKQLDRIDNSKGYYKENCRWVTPKEQNRNRSDNLLITFNNETKCVAEWCEKFKLSPTTIYNRIKAGRTPEELFVPPGTYYKERSSANTKI